MRTTTNDASAALRELGAEAARHLRQGSLRLRDIAGISEEEMGALATVADGLRRHGKTRDAIALYGLLITYDPLAGEHWRALAELQRRAGDPLAAIACFEAAALLQGRDRGTTRQEALCLEALGQPDLAASLREIGQQLDEPDAPRDERREHDQTRERRNHVDPS